MKSNLRMLGTKVGVISSNARPERVKEKSQSLFVEAPQTSHLFGKIAYIGQNIKDPGFQVGDSVYYGPHVEPMDMEGDKVLVMEVSNVIAVKETKGAETAQDPEATGSNVEEPPTT